MHTFKIGSHSAALNVSARLDVLFRLCVLMWLGSNVLKVGIPVRPSYRAAERSVCPKLSPARARARRTSTLSLPSPELCPRPPESELEPAAPAQIFFRFYSDFS